MEKAIAWAYFINRPSIKKSFSLIQRTVSKDIEGEVKEDGFIHMNITKEGKSIGHMWILPEYEKHHSQIEDTFINIYSELKDLNSSAMYIQIYKCTVETEVTVRELEKQIYDIEGIHINILAPDDKTFPLYSFPKTAGQTKFSNWVANKLSTIIGDVEYKIPGDIDHENTMAFIRSASQMIHKN